MNKTYFYILGLISLLAISCETGDLEQLNDPSNLTPDSADPALLLNNAQLRMTSAIAYNEDNEDGLGVRAAEFVRMQHLFGNYAGPFSLTAGSIDDSWTDLYREALKDIEVLRPVAEDRGFTGLVGISKVLEAYIYVTLVDTFGDVPYTEALQGNNLPNPVADSGQDIYNAMLDVLDEAIAIFNSDDFALPPGGFGLNGDLFYDGDAEKWATLARTLKFKMYVQMRLVGDYTSEINTLISQGIIDSSDEDWQFQYTTSDAAGADSRHPYYSLNYDADGADDFMTNYYMYQFLEAKGFQDPRLRYYFYRQSPIAPAGDFLDCEGDAVINFCYIGDLYWGRDHAYDAGVDPDQFLRTTYGLYPIGGAFDEDQVLNPDLFNDEGEVIATANVEDFPGAGGAGIHPYMLSSFVKFLQAESALMSGTTGNPRTLLEDAIRASMDKVLNFQSSQVNPNFAATSEDVDNYVAYVLNAYDNAAGNAGKLDIIIKEYYLALWGNGIEAYNNYRRTGFPSDISDPVISAGEFPRSFLYPATVVNTNSNITQKPVTTRVFWDNNPDGFID